MVQLKSTWHSKYCFLWKNTCWTLLTVTVSFLHVACLVWFEEGRWWGRQLKHSEACSVSRLLYVQGTFPAASFFIPQPELQGSPYIFLWYPAFSFCVSSHRIGSHISISGAQWTCLWYWLQDLYSSRYGMLTCTDWAMAYTFFWKRQLQPPPSGIKLLTHHPSHYQRTSALLTLENRVGPSPDRLWCVSDNRAGALPDWLWCVSDNRAGALPDWLWCVSDNRAGALPDCLWCVSDNRAGALSDWLWCVSENRAGALSDWLWCVSDNRAGALPDWLWCVSENRAGALSDWLWCVSENRAGAPPDWLWCVSENRAGALSDWLRCVSANRAGALPDWLWCVSDNLLNVSEEGYAYWVVHAAALK